ncbi:MAG: hypothetical protein ACLR1T_16090 [Evtepia gabavorous]
MKDYRSNEMKNLEFILCFLFLIWCTPVLESIAVAEGQSPYTALSVTLGSGLVAIILSSATLLLDCLIGSKLKDKLVGLFLFRDLEKPFSPELAKENYQMIVFSCLKQLLCTLL